MAHRFIAGLLLLCVFILPASAAQKIQRVVTPAGIEVWLVQERKIPIIALEAAWRGGAVANPKGKEGLATLAMGLMDEGSGDDNRVVFHDKLDDNAVEMGFSAGRDTLSLSLRTLSEKRDIAFELLGQALTKPRFDPEPLEVSRRQMIVALERSDSNPNALSGRTWSAAAFPDHPYGRPTDGTRESLPALTRQDVADFVSQRLARDNLVISVVGDIDAAGVATLVDKAFAGLPAKSAPLSVPDVVPVAQAAPIVVQRDIPQSVVVFGGPGLMRLDPDYYAAYVLNYVIGGGGFASRLMEEVREKRGLAYGVYTYLQPMDHAALHLGGVSTRNDGVAESLRIVRAELARLREKGVTAAELANAKSYITGSFPLQLSTNARIAGILTSVQIQRLGIDYLDKYTSYIDAVTLDQVNRVAKRLLDPDHMLTVVVGKPVGLGG